MRLFRENAAMMRYSALRTPVFDTPAPWADILGPYPETQSLEGAHTADIVIIGAGFAGLSAARQLLLNDNTLRIVVLDALRVGEGTAGRNSGFMIDLPHDLTSGNYSGSGDDQRLIALNRRAIRFAQDAVAEYGVDPAFAAPLGKVNGATSDTADAHNRSYGQHLERLGEPCEMLDAQAMAELTGSKLYESGLFTPGTLMLQPAGYVQGLAAGLRREGVLILEQSPVTKFLRSGEGWQVRSPRGQVTTGQVILATNGHLESFGIAKGRLMQLFLFASMTQELAPEHIAALGGSPRWGITPATPTGTTMRRIGPEEGGNRIITRTCARMRPGMRATKSDLVAAAATHRARFDARFPALCGIQMAATWSGHLCLSRNGVSVTRPVEDGVIAACVQNGLGTARGTLAGIAAAEMALGQRTPLVAYFASHAPPRPIPPQPFATWGANAYLRYKEWRGGAE